VSIPAGGIVFHLEDEKMTVCVAAGYVYLRMAEVVGRLRHSFPEEGAAHVEIYY
jgi:hypothetical protein